MLFQGIPWHWLLGAALAVAGVVSALFFLKTRLREEVVPSVMLWRAALPAVRRSRLWQRFCRRWHWLLLLAAIATLAAALAAPVWQYRDEAPLIVVAEPAALPEAWQLAMRAAPGRVTLIAALAGPEIVLHTQEFPVPPEFTDISLANRSEALWMAKGIAERGRILYCGNAPPPWLPEGAMWVKTMAKTAYAAPEPVKVFWMERQAPEVLPVGFAAADVPEHAEIVVSAGGGWPQIVAALRERRGGDGDGLQHVEIRALPPEELRLPQGTLALTDWLWGIGLLLVGLDLWLWTGKKVV